MQLIGNGSFIANQFQNSALKVNRNLQSMTNGVTIVKRPIESKMTKRRSKTQKLVSTALSNNACS